MHSAILLGISWWQHIVYPIVIDIKVYLYIELPINCHIWDCTWYYYASTLFTYYEPFVVLLYFWLLLLTCKFGIYFIFFFRFVFTILIRCPEIQAQWLIYGSKLTISQHFIPLNIQLVSLHYVAMFLHECKGSIMPQVLIT